MSRAITKYLFFAFVALLLIASGLALYKNFWSTKPFKIGVMTSLTGNMAWREKSLLNAAELAVQEINDSGGLLGRDIELVVRDGESNPQVFAKVAEQLIQDDEVDVVFGCWTSSCRKSVLPVFEKYDHLLYYPVQYEGLESSKNIIYLGSVPNQQMTPALEWTFSKLGKKIYLVGSDYVYPRAANQVLKNQVSALRGKVVGESYLPLGSDQFSAIVEDIKRLEPDAIFNTINGVSNQHFFKALRAGGVLSKDIPTFSFSISENEMANFSDENINGDFIILSYLQGLKNSKNRDFVQSYQQKFGKDSVPGEAAESIFLGVHLWAKSVIDAGSNKVDQVQRYASGRSIHGPSGMLYVDEMTRHSWKYMHIAQITNGVLKSVWHSKIPVSPVPYPDGQTKEQWQHYLDDLKQKWGGKWQAPQ